jgi:hypothetical protein
MLDPLVILIRVGAVVEELATMQLLVPDRDIFDPKVRGRFEMV